MTWFAPDRTPNRAPIWFVADACGALTLVFVTVVQMSRPDAVDEFGAVGFPGWLLVLGPAALIVVRRLAPLTVLAAAIGIYLVAAFEYGEGNGTLALVPLSYTVALTRPPRVSATILAIALVAVWPITFYGPGEIDSFDGGARFVFAMFFLVGWAFGTQVRAAQERQAALAEHAAATQAAVDAVARQAVAEERNRIARELHDAVGHAVNVMVMQAGAARLATQDDRAVGSLREIERVGRLALGDLDRMLGLLRATDDTAPLEPAYGLADIGRLVDGVRAAGADIEFVDQCPAELDRAVERTTSATAHRIVQEALTNAVKHAGPAHIEVTLRCDESELLVQVLDDGRGAAATSTSGGGRGLIGMRERVELLGGRLTTGPRAGGGYRVEAHIPRAEDDR